MNFLVSNHLFIYIFLFKHSFKVCPGVLWLIRINRSVVPAFLLTPVDLCTEIKAESHTEEKLSWYIWSETTLHSLYSRNSGHCAPSQVCLQSLGTGRWSSVQLTLTRTEKVCMSNPVCCGGLQTTCRDFHSVFTNKLSLTCCWFVSVHVPFQEYVDILLRPQATDTLGSGERTVSAVNISKLTDQWTERKLFANCFVDLFFQAYCKSLGFGLWAFWVKFTSIDFQFLVLGDISPFMSGYTSQPVLWHRENSLSSTETLYFFGGNNYTEWQSLFEQYEPPPYSLPHTTGAYSFGIAGRSLFRRLMPCFTSAKFIRCYKICQDFLT